MPLTPKALEAQLLDLYADQGFWTRFHVKGRVKSCPFHSILEFLPRKGVVASLGCGHGALELLTALQNPSLRIVGADLAEDKIAVAKAAAARAPHLNVSFHGDDLFTVLTRENLKPDAVLITDVLYLIPRADHPAIARRCFDQLAEEGTLLIKEMGSTPRWKRAWNSFQETVACRVLRFTLSPGSYLNFLTEDEWTQELQDIGFDRVSLVPMDAGYLHPHLLIRAQKGPVG